MKLNQKLPKPIRTFWTKEGKTHRLNKAIAIYGICSRRAADKLIADGKVKVNGLVVKDFSFLVDISKDTLIVAGKHVSARRHEYVLLHKPVRLISTCKDEFNRKSIIDLLPTKLSHLKPAGRLDYDSSGLMIMTNDGALIEAITNPKNHIEKTYNVLLNGRCSSAALKELAEGVNLNEVKTKKAKVKLLESNDKRSVIEITITEGKYRQLRRMCALEGLPVIGLIRKSIDGLQLSNLLPGRWRHMTTEEITALKKKLDLRS